MSAAGSRAEPLPQVSEPHESAQNLAHQASDMCQPGSDVSIPWIQLHGFTFISYPSRAMAGHLLPPGKLPPPPPPKTPEISLFSLKLPEATTESRDSPVPPRSINTPALSPQLGRQCGLSPRSLPFSY